MHFTNSEGETVALGRTLGRRLRAGDVVLLEGQLGAGKTAFVRGLADGAGCDAEDVSSPTFTIVQEYHGRVTFQHVDLYRLTPHEVDDLGLEELMADAVVAVEWPDRWRHAPSSAIRISLTTVGETKRKVEILEPAASHSTR